ncbi:hypothetical protein TNCV_215541 [Trichonephila clavipes]|nr:hypothetical protein TNCV_215541 [Trichonephila clavipes]
MRSTKEELVKKVVLMPDGTEKDQDSKINDSVHPTVLSSSQNHAMPVKHNVSLLNLPDVEEMPSHDGETVLFSNSPLVSMNENEMNKYRCGQRTVRLASCGIQQIQSFSRKPRNLRAQAQLSETGTET